MGVLEAQDDSFIRSAAKRKSLENAHSMFAQQYVTIWLQNQIHLACKTEQKQGRLNSTNLIGEANAYRRVYISRHVEVCQCRSCCSLELTAMRSILYANQWPDHKSCPSWHKSNRLEACWSLAKVKQAYLWPTILLLILEMPFSAASFDLKETNPYPLLLHACTGWHLAFNNQKVTLGLLALWWQHPATSCPSTKIPCYEQCVIANQKCNGSIACTLAAKLASVCLCTGCGV